MMKVRYVIQMKGINGQYAFFETKKEKELDEFIKAFQGNNNTEEIKIFRNEGMNYTLVAADHKRRIGF